MAERRALERSLALYGRRLQQVLGLTRQERRAAGRRRRLKVVGLLQQRRPRDEAEEEEEEEEDYDVEAAGGLRPPPRRRRRVAGARARRRLTFADGKGGDGDSEEAEPSSDDDDDGAEEEEEAEAWRDLEDQARSVLPRTVAQRALTLLRRLVNGGYVSWIPGTLEMVVDGQKQRGTNLVDLAGHVVRQRGADPLQRGSPGPPPGFVKFASALRRANASRELVRNRRRWGMVYDGGADDSDDEVAVATSASTGKRAGAGDDEADSEETYGTPAPKPEGAEDAFAQWESSV